MRECGVFSEVFRIFIKGKIKNNVLTDLRLWTTCK